MEVLLYGWTTGFPKHTALPHKDSEPKCGFPLGHHPYTQTSSFALRLAYVEERSKCSLILHMWLWVLNLNLQVCSLS